jgi:hypothetical protein
MLCSLFDVDWLYLFSDVRLFGPRVMGGVYVVWWVVEGGVVLGEEEGVVYFGAGWYGE